MKVQDSIERVTRTERRGTATARAVNIAGFVADELAVRNAVELHTRVERSRGTYRLSRLDLNAHEARRLALELLQAAETVENS